MALICAVDRYPIYPIKMGQELFTSNKKCSEGTTMLIRLVLCLPVHNRMQQENKHTRFRYPPPSWCRKLSGKSVGRVGSNQASHPKPFKPETF